jgi:hypothetical protein
MSKQTIIERLNEQVLPRIWRGTPGQLAASPEMISYIEQHPEAIIDLKVNTVEFGDVFGLEQRQQNQTAQGFEIAMDDNYVYCVTTSRIGFTDRKQNTPDNYTNSYFTLFTIDRGNNYVGYWSAWVGNSGKDNLSTIGPQQYAPNKTFKLTLQDGAVTGYTGQVYANPQTPSKLSYFLNPQEENAELLVEQNIIIEIKYLANTSFPGGGDLKPKENKYLYFIGATNGAGIYEGISQLYGTDPVNVWDIDATFSDINDALSNSSTELPNPFVGYNVLDNYTNLSGITEDTFNKLNPTLFSASGDNKINNADIGFWKAVLTSPITYEMVRDLIEADDGNFPDSFLTVWDNAANEDYGKSNLLLFLLSSTKL